MSAFFTSVISTVKKANLAVNALNVICSTKSTFHWQLSNSAVSLDDVKNYSLDYLCSAFGSCQHIDQTAPAHVDEAAEFGFSP